MVPLLHSLCRVASASAVVPAPESVVAQFDARAELELVSLGLSGFFGLSWLFLACSTGGGVVCAFVFWSCASPSPDCISVAPGGPFTPAPCIDGHVNNLTQGPGPVVHWCRGGRQGV